MAEAAFAVGIFEEQAMSFDRVHVNDMTDRYLLQTTRLSRDLFHEVLTLIEPQLMRQTLRANALAPDTQFIIALGFYASGGFQWLSGKFVLVSP